LGRFPSSPSRERIVRAIRFGVFCDSSHRLHRDLRARHGGHAPVYEGVLGFQVARDLSSKWIEYRLGNNTLALAAPTRTAGMR
jgi:hypothetical protein